MGSSNKTRNVLMLQGPHGPFFARLAQSLAAAGCSVCRVGFNAGDQFFWPDASTYIPFQGAPDDWPAALRALIDEKEITDIVLYGDTKPVHAQAASIARKLGLQVHVFEEGYLRPYWVSYERGGSNGNSRLMDMTVDHMQSALQHSDLEAVEAPSHWGDIYHHVFYSFFYHLLILIKNQSYRKMPSHRNLTVWQEFVIAWRRILFAPTHNIIRAVRTRRIMNSGRPYHLVLLQLEHDSAFQMHSPFQNMPEFLSMVIRDFAAGAPKHHHLVFKAHPMEMERRPLRRLLRDFAREHGIEDRVHYIPGGKLARILDPARTAVTVNSTASQQVLWRGIPLKIFGSAVYDKPEFVATAPLQQFFASPTRPNTGAYRDYRRYLLETSQIAGGFYSASGRKQLLRQVVDMMLNERDPYDAFENGDLGPRHAPKEQHLRLVP